MDKVKKIIADTFEGIANALETGSFLSKPRIIVTGIGSEHGEQTMLEGAIEGAKYAQVFYLGTLTHPNIKTINAENEKQAHEIMEKMLNSGEADGAVTMHFPFPIGVSTVGRVSTPARGKEIFIATTTGTSSTDRTEGMVLNAIYGIIAAKACGKPSPTLGILNIEGARAAELALKQLKDNGYCISFGASARSDGGAILRGNDVLTGSCDIVVSDPLTGNVVIKMLSSFNSGGGYETIGCGYGPGIGKGYDKLVMIVSRASGAPVIGGAIKYAAELTVGEYKKIAQNEFALAQKAGLDDILKRLRAKNEQKPEEAIKIPPKEVITAQISGIEITELDNAVNLLYKNGIYAESGMGCTGPIVLVSEKNFERATAIIKEGGFI